MSADASADGPAARAGRRLRRELAARAPGPRGAVLLYHRVSAAAGPPDHVVAPGRFADHVALLAARFRPLPLTELLAGTRRGRLPPGAVAVTFDDAYADVPLHALPALERHSVPATVFAVTAHARDGRGFWWDPPAAAARSATVAELQRLAAHPLIEVGSHTRKHPALTRVNGAALRTELTGSRDDLAEWLGRPPAGFAHPFGAVSRHTLRAVRAAGYAYAAGIHAAAVTRASDRFDAPRLTAYDEDAGALERRLAAALRNG